MIKSVEEARLPSLSELAGVAVFVVGLTSAWLYATGWTYAYHYFDGFGIPLLMVDLPKEYFFVYGFIATRQFAIWVLAAGIIILGLLFVGRRLCRFLGGYSVAAGVIVVLALFWLGHYAGFLAAVDQLRIQRESDYLAYPRIEVWPSKDAELPTNSPLTSGDMAKGCYRLVLHNQDRLFLIRPFRDASSADLTTLILKWDQVGMIRVLLHEASCE